MIDSLVSSGFNQTVSALHAEAQSFGLISQTVSLDDLISLPLLRQHINKKEWSKAILLLPRVRLEKSSDLPVLVFLLLIVQYMEDLSNFSLLTSSISQIRRLVTFATSLRLLFKALPKKRMQSNYDTILQCGEDKKSKPFVSTSLSIDERNLIDLSFSLDSPTPFSFFEANNLHITSGDNLWSEEYIAILSALLLIGQDFPFETIINSTFVEQFLERRLYKAKTPKEEEEEEIQHLCIQSIPLAIKENEAVEVWSCRINSSKLLAAFSNTGVVKVFAIDQGSNLENEVWCLPNFIEILRNINLLPRLLHSSFDSTIKALAIVSSICWSPCGKFLAIAGERTAFVLLFSFMELEAKLVAVFECINPIHKLSSVEKKVGEIFLSQLLRTSNLNTEVIDSAISVDLLLSSSHTSAAAAAAQSSTSQHENWQAFLKRQIESFDDFAKATVRKRNTVGISSLILVPNRLICGSINSGIFVFDLPSYLGQVEGSIYQTSVELAFVPTKPPVRSLSTLADSPTCIAALTSTSMLIILDVSSQETLTSVYTHNLGFVASSMSSSSDATGQYLLFSQVAVPISDEERLNDFVSHDDLHSNTSSIDSSIDSSIEKTRDVGKVIQWSIEKESVFATYTGHRNTRNVLEPSFGSINTQDGVVSVGSESGELCLWHTQTVETSETKQSILPFSSIKHSTSINASSWTRTTDGRNVVVTACDDGYLHLHQFSSLKK